MVFVAPLVLITAALCGADRSSSSSEPEAHAEPHVQSPVDEKRSRTKAQKKLDTQLLYAIRQRKESVAPKLVTDVEVDAKGYTLVDITANVTKQLLAKIRKLGGTVISKYENYHAIRARLPLKRLEELAGSDDVRYIMPAAEGMTH